MSVLDELVNGINWSGWVFIFNNNTHIKNTFKTENGDILEEATEELAQLRIRIAELEAAENSARVILLCVANGLVGILENEGMDTQKFISNRDASIKWLVTYPEEQK